MVYLIINLESGKHIYFSYIFYIFYIFRILIYHIIDRSLGFLQKISKNF